MTNAELIRAIRNEIERLKTVQLKRIQEGDLVDAEPYDKIEAYNELFSFISTLEESERPEPYNPVYDEAYLNEKIKKATESWKGVDVDALLAECRGYDEEKSEKPMNLCKEFDEECERYFNSMTPEQFLNTPNTVIARHFAKWGKDQMLKEAVEYEVWDFSSSLEAYPHVNIPLDNKQYRSGDKVRVIVLPKED